MAWVQDDEDGFLGDIKDKAEIEQALVEVIDPYREDDAEIDYDDDKECQFLEVV